MQLLPRPVGFLACLALASLPVPGQAQHVGSEFQVNTYTTDDQDSPAVASDGRGNFVVVWSSSDQDSSSDGVFGQRFDETGAPVGSEFRVNTYTTSSQDGAAVAAAADGNFVVVWGSFGQDGSGRGVFGQRFDNSGDPLGSEFRVNSYTTGRQEQASVASDANGNFVVVWTSRDNFSPRGSADDVFGQRYDSAGEPLGGEFRVNSYTALDEGFPSVASDANGNFVVTWISGAFLVNRGIFGQRFDANGAPQGDEFLIDRLSGPPTVASDPSGNFVVVWHDTNLYGNQDIWARRYDSAGIPQGPTFRVNSYENYYQADPSVASDADGNFLVAWADSRPPAGIYARRYDSAGVAQGDEFGVNSYTAGIQADATVASTAASQFVVAWESPDQDGDDDGVFGQRVAFEPTITVVNPNANVGWRIGSNQKIRWTHTLGLAATFRIELDRDDDGTYEELIAQAVAVDNGTRGQYIWSVNGPPAETARIRVSWTNDPEVSDASDVTFQIRPGG